MSRTCRQFLVSGRVQGVWFRESTRREALRLGLHGSATNLPDGRVKVLASGSAQAINQLSEWLQHGPRMAQVDQVTEQAMDDPGLVGFITG